MILNGIKGLLESRKGTLSLLVLILSSVAVLMGRLDGMGYAGVVGVVATIYNFTQHRVDIATLQNALPPRGQ